MDRGIPQGSKICAKRVQQRRHDLHRERVLSVRPVVDTLPPQAAHLDHVRNNLKREQMMEERYTEIDRENRILLKKMSEIMAAGGGSLPAEQGQRQQADRRPPGPMSLNRDARKKDLLRITKENQSILRRIQQAQPVYNHVEFEGGYQKAQSYLRNCVEYPLVLRTPRSARGSSYSSQLVQLPQGQDHARPMSSRSTAARQASYKDDDARKVVFKDRCWVTSAYFAVEMSEYNGNLRIIATEQGRGRLTIELQEGQHRRVYRECNGDYAQIAARLAVVMQGDRRTLAVQDAAQSRPANGNEGGELDAEAMVVYHAKTGSAGSVNAEIELGSTGGDAQVKWRGLTPSTEGGLR